MVPYGIYRRTCYDLDIAVTQRKGSQDSRDHHKCMPKRTIISRKATTSNY